MLNGHGMVKNQQRTFNQLQEKRYELLISKCNYFKINNILLGHHQEDLFENFIRILRRRIKRLDIFK